MFGGTKSGNTTVNETWKLDLTAYTWTQLTPSTTPDHRRLHDMIWDTSAKCIVMCRGHGGTVPRGPKYDVFKWDTDSDDWVDISPATADDMTQDEPHAYGKLFNWGVGGPLLFIVSDTSPSELWEYDADTPAWDELSPTSPPTVDRDANAAVLVDEDKLYMEFNNALYSMGIPPASGGFAFTGIGLEFGVTGRQKKLGSNRRM
jgi:hypothetical protein